MRIAYDVRPLQHSNTPLRGIGSVIRSQIEALSQLDAENEYILLRWTGLPAPDLTLAAPFRHRWVDVPRCPVSHATWLHDCIVLPRLLAGRADVAHFLDPFNLHVGWSARARDGRRTAVTVYDLMALTRADVLLQGKRRLLAPVYRWMGNRLKTAHLLLCISESTAREIREHLPPPLPQIRVAMLGTSEAYRPHSEAEQAEVCRRLDLPRPFLLYVGALSPNKNVHRLVEILPSLPQVALLVMVVSSPFDESHPICRAIREGGVEDRVRFLSRLPLQDLACLYSAARVAVLPSLGEGFGLPVAEAMASGTPVACSSIPALRETGAQACSFFDPTSTASMTAVLGSLWNDEGLLEQRRTDGLRRSASLRWSETARALLEAYGDLASQEGPR